MNADNVQLIPVGQSVGPLKWQMSMNGGPAKGQKDYPVVNVPANQTSDITFTIRNPGAIKFAATNAFCAQEGASKPTACDTTAFSYTIDQAGNLVVHDSNPKDATYTYVINFNGGTPQLDPIIKNGGTTTPPGGLASYSTATIVLALVALVALIALVARHMMKRSAPKAD